jgi:hypothetical protein
MISKLNIEGMNNDFKTVYQERLGHLLEKAPSDSTLTSHFLKMKKGYEGAIEVISTQGRFIANAFDKDPNELAISLIDQVYQQILSWRTKRFTLIG